MDSKKQTSFSKQTLEALKTVQALVIPFGPNASGKSEKAKLLQVLLSGLLDIVRFDMSSEIRLEIKEGTRLGRKLKKSEQQTMGGGVLVEDHLIARVTDRAISRAVARLTIKGNKRERRGVIVAAGASRTIDQAKQFMELGQWTKVLGIVFELSEDNAVQRTSERAEKARRKGEQVRPDDLNHETIRGRYMTYEVETVPAIHLWHHKDPNMLCFVNAAEPIRTQLIEICRHLMRHGLLPWNGMGTIIARLDSKSFRTMIANIEGTGPEELAQETATASV